MSRLFELIVQKKTGMRVFSRCGAILQSRVFSGCGASLQPLARYFSAQIDVRHFFISLPSILCEELVRQASKIAITKTTAPKPKKPLKELTFGTTFTDHMFVVDWVAEKGWGTPTIVPYGPFSVEPCIPAFHYAMEVPFLSVWGGFILPFFSVFRRDESLQRCQRMCPIVSP